MNNPTTATRVEALLRQAGREHRQVRATYRYHGESGVTEHERHWEPYAIHDGHAVVFSYLRNEFRTIPLKHIVDVKIHDVVFEPRRPIEL